MFFKQPLVAPDVKHFEQEPRFYALGLTEAGRRLFIVFTCVAILSA